jgi:type IV pilus assembly protein PilO
VNRRVLLIAVGASLAVIGVWYALLWTPGGSALRKAKARNAAAVEQQAQLQSKLVGLQKAKKDMPVLQAQLDTLRAAIPDQVQLDQVIATVDAASRGAGVALTTLSPAPISTAKPTPGASAGLQEVKLQMAATGSYFQVTDFVNRLNAAPRLVMVDNLSITGGAGGATGAPATSASQPASALTVSLTARMFVQPTGGAK